MSDYLKTFLLPYQTINNEPSGLGTPGTPRSSTSLALSSRSTFTSPESGARPSYTGVQRHKQTTAKRSYPYDVEYHSMPKASAPCAQGAADLGRARPGGDSLKYAQELVHYPQSGSSRAGVHAPLQTPWASAFQISTGSLTHVTLYPSSPIGSSTTPSANQAQSLPHLAAQPAESQPSRAPAAPVSVPTLPAPVRLVVHRPDSSQQDERNKLAERLRIYLQTKPEPTVGSPDNPFQIADRLGMRGLSILSAFFEEADNDGFRCTFCGDIQADEEAALVHQRRFLRTCVDVSF